MARTSLICTMLVALAAAGGAQAALSTNLLMLTPDDLPLSSPGNYWQDVSGKNHHVSNVAPPAYDGSGDPGGSAARSTALDMTQTFPDSTEQMELFVQDGFNTELNPGTGDFSVSFWYYQIVNTGFQHVIAMGNDTSGTPGYAFHLQDGEPRLRMQSAAPTGEADMRKSLSSGLGDISGSGWHHAVAVFDRTGAVGPANTVSLYVDNFPVGTPLAIDPAYDVSAPASFEMLIGGRWNNPGNGFVGYLDDIAMYQGALSASDVATLYGAASLDANTITTAGITPVMLHDFATNQGVDPVTVPNPVVDATGTYEGVPMGNRLAAVDDPQRGRVMKFPGATNNHIDFGDPGDAADDLDPGTGSYTVSLWFNAREGNTNTQIIALKGNQGSTNIGWNVWLAGGTTLHCRAMSNEGVRYDVGIPVTQGEWHHAVLVIDNENGLMQGYVDGMGSGTSGMENGWNPVYGEMTFAPGTEFSTSEPLVLGERWFASGSTAYPFDGMLDDFAVWNRALSEQEILDIFYGADILEGGVTLQGDMNADGVVNSADLDIVRANWGQAVEPGSSGDGNNDGFVNSADLDLVRANWGATAAAAVPEPSAMALLLAAAGLLAWRRK